MTIGISAKLCALCGFTFLKKYKQPAWPFLSMDPRVKPEGDDGREEGRKNDEL
jgi:hypothetical protein